MNQPLPAEQISNGWLRRYAPDGTCKHCGGALPPERRFTHERCDAAAQEKEQRVALLQGAIVDEDGEELDEDSDELKEVVNPTLLQGLAIDDPAFPPEDFWSRAAQRAATAWEPGLGGLWIHGTVGSGKSTIMAGLALRLRSEGEQVCFTSWAFLLNALRAVMRKDSERYHEILVGLGSVPALLLDDLLIRPPTDWAKEVLYQVLDDRMNRRLPLVATSNRAVDKVRELLLPVGGGTDEDKNIAQRISSRLRTSVRQHALCTYPGDRRTGEYDEDLAAVLAEVVVP